MKKTEYFDSNVEYYFLSVVVLKPSIKCLRIPFMTKQEIDEFLKNIYLPNPSNYCNLEINNESTLREKILIENINNEVAEVDLRLFMFDERYSTNTEYYKSIMNRQVSRN
jgi:hypothetical protein